MLICFCKTLLFFKESVNACHGLLKVVVQKQAETTVILKRLFEIEKKKQRFPIESIQELEALNNKIEEDREKYVSKHKDVWLMIKNFFIF